MPWIHTIVAMTHPNSIVAAALAAIIFGGCSSPTIGGKKGFATANDELRRRVVELEDQNRLLASQRDELSVKLAEEQRVREGLVTADVLAAIPRCAGIEIDSLSGIDPLDPSKPATGLILYVEPFDGERRFVQLVGTVRVEALELSEPAGTVEPRRIAGAALTPPQVRGAYRSGITGTHYEIPLKLPDSESARIRASTLLLRVQFDDAITGTTHEATMMVSPRTR